LGVATLKTFPFVFIIMVLASNAHAENPRLNFQLANGRFTAQLIPVPSEDSYDCEAPSTPAQIVFSENLKPFNFNATPFYHGTPKSPICH